MLSRTLLALAVLGCSGLPSLAASYTLQIENPQRRTIVRTGVVGAKVTGPTCGSRPVCVKTVTLPDGVCGGDVWLTMYNGTAREGVNWCQSGRKVILEFVR